MIDFERITQAGGEAIASAEIIAATVVVIEGDQVTYRNGFGTTRFDNGVPVTPDTLFPYCSICKTLNAIVIMRLVEEGVLELDRPVVEYLPGFKFRNEAYGKRITLRHLLSHTSGLPMSGRGFGLMAEDTLSRSIWEEVPHYRFSAEPGLVCNYANATVCMAGYIAEAVTGRNYDDLLADYVLNPLGMSSCRWDLSHTSAEEIAYSHYPTSDGNLGIREKFPSNRAGHPSSFYYGSINDLANVAIMLLNPGMLLQQSSIDEMMQPHGNCHMDSATHFINQQEQTSGLGLMQGHYRQQRVVRHGGGIPGYAQFFQLFPEQNRAVIIFTACFGENALIEFVKRVQDAVLELPASNSPHTPPPKILPYPEAFDRDSVVGQYLNPENGQMVTVERADDGLNMKRFGRSFALSYTETGEFIGWYNEHNTMPVYFVQGKTGRVQHVCVHRTPYQRLTEPLSNDIDVGLVASYVGRYRDPFNLKEDDILTVALQDDQLFIYHGDTLRNPVQAFSATRFLTGIGVAEFEISAENTVTAVQIGHTTRYFPIK